MLFAATRAPSGSNRQPFRFVVLRDGPKARQAKELIATSARAAWGVKRATPFTCESYCLKIKASWQSMAE